MAFHWIVVADASRARLYSADPLLTRLELVDAFDNPLGRRRTSELVSDGPGRSHGSPSGSPSAHGVESDAHDREEVAFAGVVAERVHAGRDRFSRLVVAAPPRFLGQLRDALDADVRGRVAVEVHHDYTKMDPERVAELLRQHLAAHPA